MRGNLEILLTAPHSLASKMFRDQGGRCCYCERLLLRNGHPTHPLSITREHLRRREEGGTHEPGNLRFACRECNTKRGRRTWLEWKTIRMGESMEAAE